MGSEYIFKNKEKLPEIIVFKGSNTDIERITGINEYEN